MLRVLGFGGGGRGGGGSMMVIVTMLQHYLLEFFVDLNSSFQGCGGLRFRVCRGS